jgi:hypothetical protein
VLRAGVAVVRGAGYGVPSDNVGPDGLPLLHHALRHDQRELPPVELHWRIHWYERRFAADMLARSAEDSRGIRRPMAPDELASLLLFYARDGFLDLRLATDIGAWWDAHGSRMTGPALAEILGRYPELDGALRASAVVAERIVGLPGTRLLGARPRLGRRARLAVAMADPNPSASPEQLGADASLVDWLLSPHGQGRAFAQRHLLVTRRAEGEHRPGPRQVLSPGHVGRVLGRFALRIGRLLADSSAGRAAYAPSTSPRSSS